MNFHWLSRRKRVAELNEELESHVTMAAKDLVARGALKTAAAHAARRELGNFSLVREVTQDAWGGRWWRDLLVLLAVLLFGVVTILALNLMIVRACFGRRAAGFISCRIPTPRADDRSSDVDFIVERG